MTNRKRGTDDLDSPFLLENDLQSFLLRLLPLPSPSTLVSSPLISFNCLLGANYRLDRVGGLAESVFLHI